VDAVLVPTTMLEMHQLSDLLRREVASTFTSSRSFGMWISSVDIPSVCSHRR